MLRPGRIRHTVSFTLRHATDSPDEASFLAAAQSLAAIEGVEAFELLRQVGSKSAFRFGIAMEFADDTAYGAYNEHPEHVRFVAERWVPEVTDFLELDFVTRTDHTPDRD